MQCLTIARSKWSRRKLTLLSKAPYLFLLVMEKDLVHAVIHVHKTYGTVVVNRVYPS